MMTLRWRCDCDQRGYTRDRPGDVVTSDVFGTHYTPLDMNYDHISVFATKVSYIDFRRKTNFEFARTLRHVIRYQTLSRPSSVRTCQRIKGDGDDNYIASDLLSTAYDEILTNELTCENIRLPARSLDYCSDN
jgi:hypothetical protein